MVKRVVYGLAFLGAIAIAAPPFVKLVTNQSVVISDISVPSALDDRGLGGAVISQRILDHLQEVVTGTGSRKGESAVTGSSIASQLPEIQLPVGGLSLGGLVTQVRAFLGYRDTTISGEIVTATVGDSDKDTLSTYTLRLRMGSQGVIYNSPKASDNVDSLIEDAAMEIMHRFDPINLGFYHYKKKDYANAYRMTETAIANDTPGDDGWAFNMRGLIQRDQRHYPEAIAQFREAIRREPAFVYAYSNLSQTLRMSGQFDEAAQAARKVIELAPKERQGYTNLALVLIEQGKGDEAVELMNKAVAAEPRSHHSHFDLGVILQRLKRLDASAAAFRKSAEVKPDFADAYMHLSNVLHLTGNYPEALALAQKAADLDPKSPMPWNLLGLYALERKDYPHAAASFRKATAIDKVFVEGYGNLGIALSGEKKYPDAIAAFRKAAEFDPTNADILVHWAEALEAHGDAAGAIDSYRKAIVLDPKAADALNVRIARLSQGRARH
ncbi:unnamed protein product [Phaeothamnion confervicola]